jgi:hypothetical protein
MPPATRSDEREEERRLNTRTLTVASAASATAAAVTSQLWIAGTWIAAALTPVLVAVISEAMHRPTERIARAWTSDRPALGVRRASPGEPVAPPHGDPLQPPGAGPVRVYRQSTARAPRRRIALGAVAATAAIGFVVGVIALTAGDLVSGGSIGKGGGRTTLLGGHGKKQEQEQQQDATPNKDTPDQTGTTTNEAPTTETEPAPEAPPSDTAPITPPVDPTQTEQAPDPLP